MSKTAAMMKMTMWKLVEAAATADTPNIITATAMTKTNISKTKMKIYPPTLPPLTIIIA